MHPWNMIFKTSDVFDIATGIIAHPVFFRNFHAAFLKRQWFTLSHHFSSGSLWHYEDRITLFTSSMACRIIFRLCFMSFLSINLQFTSIIHHDMNGIFYFCFAIKPVMFGTVEYARDICKTSVISRIQYRLPFGIFSRPITLTCTPAQKNYFKCIFNNELQITEERCLLNFLIINNISIAGRKE